MDRRTIMKHCARLERMVGFARMLTDADWEALRRVKEGTRRGRGTDAKRDCDVRPLTADSDRWKAERPLIGNYGLRRALIDLAIEWDVPAHIADLLSCHAEPLRTEQGKSTTHGTGTRKGI